MTHINEDRLLEFALKIYTDENVRVEIDMHLAECPQCRALLARIQDEVNFIGSIRPPVRFHPLPTIRRRESFVATIARTAALIIFGAFVGLGIASWNRSEPICVMPAYAVSSPLDASRTGYAVSEATSVKTDYYAQSLSIGK